VYFAGFVEDVAGVLPSLDAVCMASLSEALPFAILEAASYARPILATAVGGMASLLEDGVTALLVPPRDPDALAQGLRWLYANQDKAKELGCAAYQMVQERFNVSNMVEETLRIYDRALIKGNTT
jgi:glycosyltransferase involved in cell wall biosynthesis